MPSPLYAVAITITLVNLFGSLGLFFVARGLPSAKRARATAVWAVWTAGALGLEAYIIVSLSYLSVGLAGDWSLVGLLAGIRLVRVRRRARKAREMPRALTAPLPEAAAACLKERGVEKDDVLAAASADVSLDGGFATDLVVVTKERLYVLHFTDDDVTVARDFGIAELKDIRAESLIGGGRLVIRRDESSGHPELVARYSNARGRDFSQIAKKLGEHIKPKKPDDEKGEKEKDEEKKELTFKEPEGEAPKNCLKCGRKLEENSTVCPACVKRGRVLVRLLGISREYWKSILVLFVLMLATAGTSLAPPYLMKILIDDVLKAGAGTVTFVGVTLGKAAMLGAVTLTMVGLMVFESIVTMIRGRLAVRVGGRVGTDLRARVFHHLQVLSLGYFDKQKTGALMSRTDSDTRQLTFFLIEGVQIVTLMLLQLVGIAVILFLINWRLAVWVLLPAPVILAFSSTFWRIVIGKFRRLWERVARLSAFLNDSISGVRVVKAFGQEEREKSRFDVKNEAVYDGLVQAETAWASLGPWLGFVMHSSGLIVWYIGGLGVLGEDLTLGALFAFTMYLGRFFGPLHVLSRLNDWLTRSATAAERVFEVLDARPDVAEAEEPVELDRLKGDVELKDVTFGYDKFKPVLKSFSLKVASGEMIGLVGHSGAGKSTTINLVCRLYDVDEGALLFDGVDVKNFRIADLRRQIGVVLQETYLFSGSVAENIAYARPEATKERILEAAAAANAHDFVMKMADGYDSEVGERGKKLSGGEKQRIAIARAVLHNPRILILDEATSSVDSETEKAIQLALERLVKDRTTFAIAHRLSTLRHAHRLVVLENGELKEAGTHEELLAKHGIYYKLVQTQAEMSEQVAVGG